MSLNQLNSLTASRCWPTPEINHELSYFGGHSDTPSSLKCRLPRLFSIYFYNSILYILPVGTSLSALQIDGSQWSTAASVQRASLSFWSIKIINKY